MSRGISENASEKEELKAEVNIKNGIPLSKGYNDTLDKISKEVDTLRNYSYPFSDILLDDIQKIIDKHRE